MMPCYDDDDEEEAISEDLADLSPAQQLRRVLFRSIWMMGIGTLLVLIFSDPMVYAHHVAPVADAEKTMATATAPSEQEAAAFTTEFSDLKANTAALTKAGAFSSERGCLNCIAEDDLGCKHVCTRQEDTECFPVAGIRRCTSE